MIRARCMPAAKGRRRGAHLRGPASSWLDPGLPWRSIIRDGLMGDAQLLRDLVQALAGAPETLNLLDDPRVQLRSAVALARGAGFGDARPHAPAGVCSPWGRDPHFIRKFNFSALDNSSRQPTQGISVL